MDHRWSGWPGAWCFDCGTEDAREICVATHDAGLTCVEGHYICEEGHVLQACPEHTNPPCPEPGSNQHNPYMRPRDESTGSKTTESKS